jgi:hypothetical protein
LTMSRENPTSTKRVSTKSKETKMWEKQRRT